MRELLIIHPCPWPIGGFSSFTRHMISCLVEAKWTVYVVKPNRDRTESFSRYSSHLDCRYQNRSVAHIVQMQKAMPSIITGIVPKSTYVNQTMMSDFVNAGAWTVVHDSNEFEREEYKEYAALKRPKTIIIRQSMKKHFDRSVKYLPHPYKRFWDDTDKLPSFDARDVACSLAMVAPKKHPEIIIEANMNLIKRKRIVFQGQEVMRFYGMALEKKFKSYRKPKILKDPRPVIAAGYRLNIDLTDFPQDGGGTQYSFLEAMDGGAVNVIHSNWAAQRGEMQADVNCLAVSNVEELTRIVKRTNKKLCKLINSNVQELLEKHGPLPFARALGRIL